MRTEYPAWPVSWYLFCQGRELRRGPLSRDLLGRRLVAFRTESGRVGVLDARCSHMGADLGRGHVAGEALRCPFHSWEYGSDGRCTHVPAQQGIPTFARQACYPAVERHGLVFVFNGRRPLFPLPFFDGERPEGFVPGRPFRFSGKCPWQMVGANGFDCQHLTPVHGREIVTPPRVDSPDAFARRIRYRSRVTGISLCDRLLRATVGNEVEVSISVWGGNFCLVTAGFRRAESHILFSVQPAGDAESVLDGVPFARRGISAGAAVVRPMTLWVRRLLTMAFVRGDFDRLTGIRYNPLTVIDSDRTMAEYFDWLATLPAHANGAAAVGGQGPFPAGSRPATNGHAETLSHSYPTEDLP